MIKDSSNILPLGDKWWVRESEPGRMCEIESTQRQDIFQCQLSLVCIVDCHWLCECKSGQITDADPPESVFFVLFIVIVVQHLNNFNIINSPSFLQWLILFNLINYGTNCTYCLWVFPALCSPLHLTFFFFFISKSSPNCSPGSLLSEGWQYLIFLFLCKKDTHVSKLIIQISTYNTDCLTAETVWCLYGVHNQTRVRSEKIGLNACHWVGFQLIQVGYVTKFHVLYIHKNHDYYPYSYPFWKQK